MSTLNMHLQQDFDYPSDRVWDMLGNFGDIGWCVGIERTELSGKPTTIRGQVVKVNTGIMGKNWLHLRDASGTDAAKDNDLTVITKDVAAVGDVVVATGKVTTNKDFGAGYSYPVVLEDAAVKK